MSEHDYNIANQSYPAVRADINNALLACISKNSKATEPSNTFAYMWWMDTASGLLKIRDAADSAWVIMGALGGSGFIPYNQGAPVGSGAVTGEIRMFGGSAAPAGWYLCQGQEKNRTADLALFNVIGESYGAGNGTTTFNLPDLRGRSPVGAGQGDTAEGGGAGTDRTLGAKGGAETHTLIEDELAAHDHDYNSAITPDSIGSGGGSTFVHLPQGYTTTQTGGDQPHNNMHPWQAVNFIIKA